MFGRCNAHVEALPQRLLAAPGRMFMHVPQIVRICAFLVCFSRVGVIFGGVLAHVC